MASNSHHSLDMRLLLLLLATMVVGQDDSLMASDKPCVIVTNDAKLIAYLKPQCRWIAALQNDFAARADWCVKEFNDANRAPVVTIDGLLTRDVKPGERVNLPAPTPHSNAPVNRVL